jgi:hypothetical protein
MQKSNLEPLLTKLAVDSLATLASPSGPSEACRRLLAALTSLFNL